METKLRELEETITELLSSISTLTEATVVRNQQLVALREWAVAHPPGECERIGRHGGNCGTCLPCRVRRALKA